MKEVSIESIEHVASRVTMCLVCVVLLGRLVPTLACLVLI